MPTILCILMAICSVISGEARVWDGDTISINGQSIRLQGVDAEELSEPTGHAAKDVLQQIVNGQTVVCHPEGTMSYKRIVARCYVSGIDIAIPMVAGGWALDCAAFSGGRYRPYELPGARSKLIQKGYCR